MGKVNIIAENDCQRAKGLRDLFWSHTQSSKTEIRQCTSELDLINI